MSRRTWWLLCTTAGLGALLVLTAATGLLMLPRWEAWSITTQPNGEILIAGNADAFRDSRRVPSFRVGAH